MPLRHLQRIRENSSEKEVSHLCGIVLE